MPLSAIRYDKTLFYKIVCRDVNIKDTYVGHTTDFKSRKCIHKHYCTTPSSRKYNFHVYTVIREHGGWDNWDMILIESRSCENRLDASRVERTHMENLQANLNRQVPSRTMKQYRQEPSVKAWQKTKLTCECGGIYTNCHKAQHFKTKRHLEHTSQQG